MVNKCGAVIAGVLGLALGGTTPGAARAYIPDGRIAVTPDILLRDFQQTSFEVGINRIDWTGGGRFLVVETAGRRVPGLPPIPHKLQLIDVLSGQARTVGEGQLLGVASNAVRLVFFRPDGSLAIYNRDRRLTCTFAAEESGQVSAVKWSQDGSSLLVATSISGSVSGQPTATPDGPSVRTIREGSWEFGAPAGTKSRITRIDADCWQIGRQIDIPYARIGSIADLGGGVIAAEAYREEANLTHGIVDILRVAGPQNWQVLAPNVGGQARGTLISSPSGKLVAFTYDPDGFTYLKQERIAVIDVASGEFVSKSTELTDSASYLSNDGVLLASRIAPFYTLRSSVIFDGSGGEHELIGVSGYARMSPDGRRIAWTDTDLYGNSSLRVARFDPVQAILGAPRTLVRVPSPLRSYRRAHRSLQRCHSRDGIQPAAVLISPQRVDRSSKYPLIVDIHGGPRAGLSASDGRYGLGSILGTTPLEHEMWSEMGYFSLLPDYRESGVHGFERIRQSIRQGSVTAENAADILCNIDQALARYPIDPTRIYVLGHSAGGKQVNWLVTHSSRFRAGVSYEAESAVPAVEWGGQGVVNRVYNQLRGAPYENREGYAADDALSTATQFATPMMFVSSYGGLQKGDQYPALFAAWRAHGVEAEYRVYSGEGHVIEKPENQRDLLRAVISWFDRYQYGRVK